MGGWVVGIGGSCVVGRGSNSLFVLVKKNSD